MNATACDATEFCRTASDFYETHNGIEADPVNVRFHNVGILYRLAGRAIGFALHRAGRTEFYRL